MSSREFNQQVSRARRAALDGPVFITDRGVEAFVLLNIADFRVSTRRQQGLFDMIAMADADGMDFDLDDPGRTLSEAKDA
jgi:PHD/YefM family antitoxin component YafN of YafNO toxin-antitoxin module